MLLVGGLELPPFLKIESNCSNYQIHLPSYNFQTLETKKTERNETLPNTHRKVWGQFFITWKLKGFPPKKNGRPAFWDDSTDLTTHRLIFYQVARPVGLLCFHVHLSFGEQQTAFHWLGWCKDWPKIDMFMCFYSYLYIYIYAWSISMG